MSGPVRYVSAEVMTKDDFDVPFTNQPGEVIYDARLAQTTMWATMTQVSWEKHGCGFLGTGSGQKYVRQVNGELHKVEG